MADLLQAARNQEDLNYIQAELNKLKIRSDQLNNTLDLKHEASMKIVDSFYQNIQRKLELNQMAILDKLKDKFSIYERDVRAFKHVTYQLYEQTNVLLNQSQQLNLTQQERNEIDKKLADIAKSKDEVAQLMDSNLHFQVLKRSTCEEFEAMLDMTPFSIRTSLINHKDVRMSLKHNLQSQTDSAILIQVTLPRKLNLAEKLQLCVDGGDNVAIELVKSKENELGQTVYDYAGSNGGSTIQNSANVTQETIVSVPICNGSAYGSRPNSSLANVLHPASSQQVYQPNQQDLSSGSARSLNARSEATFSMHSLNHALPNAHDNPSLGELVPKSLPPSVRSQNLPNFSSQVHNVQIQNGAASSMPNGVHQTMSTEVGYSASDLFDDDDLAEFELDPDFSCVNEVVEDIVDVREIGQRNDVAGSVLDEAMFNHNYDKPSIGNLIAAENPGIKGELVLKIEGVRKPIGVAKCERTGTYIICDTDNNMIRTFDKNGILVHSQRKAAQGTPLLKPSAVQIIPDPQRKDDPIIAVKDEKQIHLFVVKELKPVFSFGDLKSPKGLAVDSDGNLWTVTSDKGVNELVCFTPLGGQELCRHTFKLPVKPDVNPFPCFIDIIKGGNRNDDVMILSDYGLRRLFGVLLKTGAVLGAMGCPGELKALGEFNRPSGVDHTSDEYVVVGDAGNDRIQVFERDGTPACVMELDPPGCGWVSDLKMTRDGHLIVCCRGGNYVAVFKLVAK